MRQKEDTSSASLSFLDVIACAFGAIVLLVLILPVGTLGILADSQPLADALEQFMLESLHLDGEIDDLNEQIENNKEMLKQQSSSSSMQDKESNQLRESIKKTQQEIRQLGDNIHKTNRARVQLTKSIERQTSALKQTESYAGIPVDSEYVAIVIDTSGSMQGIWGQVLKEVEGVLSLYPEIKGFQILSDQGDYLFKSERGKWMKDSPSKRRSALAALRRWRANSNSSPDTGIRTALKDLYAQSENMALFIFGDDFSSSQELDEYITEIDLIVRRANVKEDSLRIHAFGFQNEESMIYSPIRFMVVMNELTRRHSGAFLTIPMYERQLRLPE